MAWNLTFCAWVIASSATLGSLFFSEVMKLPPCVLCWYQRVGLFPLVFIFLAGMFPFDKRVFTYSLPFVLGGWLLALYHNLVFYKVIPESMTPCSEGVSCAEAHLQGLGFVSIPLLSLAAFSVLFVLLIFIRKFSHET